MYITIEINTDNAAFEENGAGEEVAKILHGLANTIAPWPGANSFSLGVRDTNGNKVGTFSAIES